MDMFSGLNLGEKLSAFQSNTNNAMKNVNSSTLTPMDATAKNIKEGVALKTARDTSVSGTISQYRSSVVEELDGIVGFITGGLLKTSDITKAIRVGRDGVTFSDDAIIAAVGGSLGYPVNGKSGVMRKIASGVSAEFKRITGLNIGSILTANGTEFRVNKNWRGQVGQQVLRMVGDTIGIDEFLDYSVKGAIYNNVLYNAVGYGMTGSYAKLYAAYPPGFYALRRDATLVAMQTAITNGDLESMDALLKLMETESRMTLLGKYPNFISDLFSKFKFDDGVYPEDHPAVLAKLKSVVSGIAGEEWYYRYTAFGKAYNLGLIMNVSADMKVLLLQWPEIIPLVAFAGQFKETKPIDQLRSMFPNAAQFDK